MSVRDDHAGRFEIKPDREDLAPDTEVDEDAEAAWATEVTRRVTELDNDAVKTIPWAEVRRRLAAR